MRTGTLCAPALLAIAAAAVLPLPLAAGTSADGTAPLPAWATVAGPALRTEGPLSPPSGELLAQTCKALMEQCETNAECCPGLECSKTQAHAPRVCN
jgi:hypothetical protein